MTSKWDLKSCIHSAPLSELYAASSSGVCQSVCPALKVKQDVFSGRRPFQSRQIPDNLSKFALLISASNNSALFVPPTVCSKVGNRRGNLGHSSPRCEQSIPSNSAIHKTPPRSESDQPPGSSGCSGRREIYDGGVGRLQDSHFWMQCRADG